jgi:hypothetical protein
MVILNHYDQISLKSKIFLAFYFFFSEIENSNSLIKPTKCKNQNCEMDFADVLYLAATSSFLGIVLIYNIG